MVFFKIMLYILFPIYGLIHLFYMGKFMYNFWSGIYVEGDSALSKKEVKVWKMSGYIFLIACLFCILGMFLSPFIEPLIKFL